MNKSYDAELHFVPEQISVPAGGRVRFVAQWYGPLSAILRKFIVRPTSPLMTMTLPGIETLNAEEMANLVKPVQRALYVVVTGVNGRDVHMTLELDSDATQLVNPLIQIVPNGQIVVEVCNRSAEEATVGTLVALGTQVEIAGEPYRANEPRTQHPELFEPSVGASSEEPAAERGPGGPKRKGLREALSDYLLGHAQHKLSERMYQMGLDAGFVERAQDDIAASMFAEPEPSLLERSLNLLGTDDMPHVQVVLNHCVGLFGDVVMLLRKMIEIVHDRLEPTPPPPPPPKADHRLYAVGLEMRQNGAGVEEVKAGETVVMTIAPQATFRAINLRFAAERKDKDGKWTFGALDGFKILDIKVGKNSQLITGFPLEVRFFHSANDIELKLDTCQVAMLFQVMLRNDSSETMRLVGAAIGQAF